MLMLNFSSGYLSVSCMDGKQLEGKEHALFTIWLRRGCHGIKSWPYLNSYETIRPHIMMPVLKMKRRLQNGSATRRPESKSWEAWRATGPGGTIPGLQSWGCATFWEIWGILMKLSMPQCLQLQNKDNKVPSLTATIHFFKRRHFSYSQ